MTEGILLNQEKIRTIGEKETKKYLGLLETDSTKQVEIREDILKSISGEPECFSGQNI